MRTVVRPIQAEFVETRCHQCATGVYRMAQEQSERSETWFNPVVIECNPTTWQLTCHHCGHQIDFAWPAPHILYRGRKFVLQDSVDEKVSALRALLRTIMDR